MLQAKLIVVAGDVKTKEVTLKLPVIIGRGREATLTVPHALISRLHCQITEREGRLFVKDLGSLNGTFVDNYRIDEEHLLLPDQLLTLGTITFRASYEVGDEAAKPAPQSTEVPSAAPMPLTVQLAATVHADTWRAAATTDTPISIVAVDPATSEPVRSAPQPAAPPPPSRPSRNPEAAPHGSAGERIRIAIDEPLQAEKSICLASLGALPEGDPGLSFRTPVEVGGDGQPSVVETSSIDVVGDEPPPAAVDDAESALQSFFKKIPR